MRAGPLSNSKVIELLNRYFVPVTTSNTDNQDVERNRIRNDSAQKKLGLGDVHVYVLGPDGGAIDGLDIGRAMDANQEISLLTRVAERLHTPPGPPVFPPHPQSAPPQVEAGAPAIHLVARKQIPPTSWNEFPSENWILLSRQEWDQILPPADTGLHGTWTIPHPVAVKLAEWIYPQTEDIAQTNRSRVDQVEFRMTVVTQRGTLARAKIEGRVRLYHSFYPKRPHEDYANSELIGYADFDLSSRQVQRLRIVTSKAEYVGTAFDCTLVSVSKETLDARQ